VTWVIRPKSSNKKNYKAQFLKKILKVENVKKKTFQKKTEFNIKKKGGMKLKKKD
jgi:hypothetical protein